MKDEKLIKVIIDSMSVDEIKKLLTSLAMSNNELYNKLRADYKIKNEEQLYGNVDVIKRLVQFKNNVNERKVNNYEITSYLDNFFNKMVNTDDVSDKHNMCISLMNTLSSGTICWFKNNNLKLITYYDKLVKDYSLEKMVFDDLFPLISLYQLIDFNFGMYVRARNNSFKKEQKILLMNYIYKKVMIRGENLKFFSSAEARREIKYYTVDFLELAISINATNEALDVIKKNPNIPGYWDAIHKVFIKRDPRLVIDFFKTIEKKYPNNTFKEKKFIIDKLSDLYHQVGDEDNHLKYLILLATDYDDVRLRYYKLLKKEYNDESIRNQVLDNLKDDSYKYLYYIEDNNLEKIIECINEETDLDDLLKFRKYLDLGIEEVFFNKYFELLYNLVSVACHHAHYERINNYLKTIKKLDNVDSYISNYYLKCIESFPNKKLIVEEYSKYVSKSDLKKIEPKSKRQSLF